MKIWKGYQRGVNFGGWLSQFGTYDEKHFASFITEEDFMAARDMGFDHVRIPVDFVLLESDDEKAVRNPLGYACLKKAVSWCRKYSLRMVLDIHEVYGYSFDPLKDMDRERFFYDAKLQARFRRLWCSIAEAFREDADIVAFELLNEVVLTSVYEAWNNVARSVIAAIREIIPDVWIVLGGVQYNNVNAVPLLCEPYDDHIVYNFHCYEPFMFTHQGAYWVANMPQGLRVSYPDVPGHYLEMGRLYGVEIDEGIYAEPDYVITKDFFKTFFVPAVQTAEKYDVPLYCGEYGVIDQASPADTLNWFRDIHSAFEACGIGRAVWNYREKDFGITGARLDPVRDELITCF